MPDRVERPGFRRRTTGTQSGHDVLQPSRAMLPACQPGAYVSATGYRREIVEAIQNPCVSQPLQRAKSESRAPDTAARNAQRARPRRFGHAQSGELVLFYFFDGLPEVSF